MKKVEPIAKPKTTNVQPMSVLESLSEAIKLRRDMLVKNNIDTKNDDEDDDWD